MPINLDDIQKLEVSSVPASGQLPADPGALIAAIVKVKKANYKPKNVRVRAKVSPLLLTCEFTADALAALEKDPNVESVALSKPFQLG